ncbi:MAG: MBL fold metallo-hydrolase [Candidatus Omnitrophota bacterium]
MKIDNDILIKNIPLGPMGNLAYFIVDKKTRKSAVVDPAWDIPLIMAEAKKLELEIVCGLLTHGHYDHSDGVKDLTKELNIPIYISEKEIKIYLPECPNLKTTKNQQKIKIGNLEITCIHTPGHAPGCQCFHVGNHLLTGDTLFVNACGRCDLPGGSAKAMYHTLYKVIGQLPDETIIYPGHAYGPRQTSTLGQERRTNPYLTCSNEVDFLENRMS